MAIDRLVQSAATFVHGLHDFGSTRTGSPAQSCVADGIRLRGRTPD